MHGLIRSGNIKFTLSISFQNGSKNRISNSTFFGISESAQRCGACNLEDNRNVVNDLINEENLSGIDGLRKKIM